MTAARAAGDRPVAGVTVDLDDTLYPQADHLAGAFDAVAALAASRRIDGTALRAALGTVAAQGSDRGGVIDRALAAVDPAAAADPALVGALVATFRSYAPDTLRPYPGALEALAEVRRVVPVVVVTDGAPSVQRGKVTALGLGPLVDGVVISDEMDRALRKPHPAPFRRALTMLGLPAGAVVHVGDRPGKDTAGAARVGMRAVRVHTGEYAHVADDPLRPPWRTAPDAATALRDLLPLLRPVRARTADAAFDREGSAAVRG